MFNLPTEIRRTSLEMRLARLESNGKNLKCPGVLRRIRRELRNLDK